MGDTKAFVEGRIENSRSLKSNVEIHYGEESMEALAIWDTGATNSCISHNVVRKLGMKSGSRGVIRTPARKKGKRVKGYEVDVVLQGQTPLTGLTVYETEIGTQDIDMLIGMDIIERGDFLVNNWPENATFSFRMPSQPMSSLAGPGMEI